MSELTSNRFNVNSMRACIVLGLQDTRKQGCAMVSRCANQFCLTPRRPDMGKMFRLDIDLGNKAGGSERKTAYIWLCSGCAEKMHPKIQITGNTITLLLSRNDPMRTDTATLADRVI